MRQDSPLLTPPYKTQLYTTPPCSTEAEETHLLVIAGLDTGIVGAGWAESRSQFTILQLLQSVPINMGI